MPTWNDLLNESKEAGSTQDVIRRKYLRKLFNATGRNVILYYSGWLQKASLAKQGVSFELNDGDKNGFMSAIHELDRSKGLDLFLHTPGGSMAATESLVDYLRWMFGSNIRAVVPQIALSAGTMVALSCREIIMGKHSSLGPIDPQISGVSAHGVIEEFTTAKNEVTNTPVLAHVWQPIIAKYHPTLIGDCQKAIKWSNDMVKEWLVSGMFEGESDAGAKADRIVTEMGDHSITMSHERHISMQQARDLGVKVSALEDDQALQDKMLTVHHACIQTLSSTGAFKMIENQNGIGYFQTVGTVKLQQG